MNQIDSYSNPLQRMHLLDRAPLLDPSSPNHILLHTHNHHPRRSSFLLRSIHILDEGGATCDFFPSAIRTTTWPYFTSPSVGTVPRPFAVTVLLLFLLPFTSNGRSRCRISLLRRQPCLGHGRPLPRRS